MPSKPSFTNFSPAGAIAALAVLIPLAVIMASSTYRPIFLSGPGIAQGALIAAIALGVVLTFRGSGVVNLANGAIAMYAAFFYAILRGQGDIFLPPLPNPLVVVEWVVHLFQADDTLDLWDIPVFISVGPNMQFWPALIITILFCVLMGLLLHFALFRPLRHAPPLAKVVATVGVFLFLQAVILRRFSTTPVSVKAMPFVSKSERIDLGITTLNQEQLFVAVFVIVVTAALAWLFGKTRFGLATRAASENEKGAVALGYSPDFLAGTNWVLSTVITGILGVFVASINSTIDSAVIPALIVPALTAALVGGFRSFGLTTLAAFLLGMQLPVIQTAGVRESWYPKAGSFSIPGVDTMIPLIVIVAVLFLRGNALPGRGALQSGRLPSAPTPGRRSIFVVGPIAAGLALLCLLFFFGPTNRDAFTTSLIAMIVCLSLVIVTGFLGQISLAPLTFAGLSAFLVAELSLERGWPFPVPILAGALLATLVGLHVALPALRIRGVNLAIITLSFALAADRFIFDNADVNGGILGARVDTPEILQQSRATSWTLLGQFTAGDDLRPNPMTGVMVLVAVVILAYATANLRRSTWGRRFIAVRANERAAAAAGIPIAKTKAIGFGFSAFVAGVAGGLIAYRAEAATQQSFEYQLSLVFFAFAYLGGISRVSGAIAGGLIAAGGLAFVTLEHWFGIPDEFTLLIGGLGLMVAPILNPEGMIAAFEHQAAFARRLFRGNEADTRRAEL